MADWGKIGIGVSLLALASIGNAAMEDTLEYYDTDDYGNVVYFVKNTPNQIDFIMVDGSASVGMFSSANVASIAQSGKAGYAVVPAASFQEMSKNAQFAKTYFVDCLRNKIQIEERFWVNTVDMSAFHGTSAAMACSVLESLK